MNTFIAVGIGNLLRCDDGAGIHVIKQVSELVPQVDTFELALGSIDLIEAILGYTWVYIIDAVETGAEPGTVFQVKLSSSGVFPRVYSSHGVDLFTTLELGETLYPETMPQNIIVYGIEVEDVLSFTSECTEPVSHAVGRVVDEIHRHVSEVGVGCVQE